MKYKVWVDVNVRGTVIVDGDDMDEAARKARDSVQTRVKRIVRLDRHPPTSRPGIWFVAVKMASERDVANHKKRRKDR